MRLQVLFPILVAIAVYSPAQDTQPVLADPLPRQPIQVAQSIWKPFSPAGGGFTVLLPGTPTTQSQPQNTAVGQIETYTFAVERAGEAAYLVTYADFPTSVIQGADPSKLFDGGRDEALRRSQGKLIREQNITLNGSPGREMRIEVGTGLVIRNRMYLVNQRLYQVIAVTSPQKEPYLRKSLQGFLDSFKLMQPAPATSSEPPSRPTPTPSTSPTPTASPTPDSGTTP